MELSYEQLGLYNANVHYLKYLYDIDHEVYYNENHYDRKPFIGIVVGINGYHYFIPLTSRKASFKNASLEDTSHLLIYERIQASLLDPHAVYKKIPKSNDVYNILGAITINKMIPIPPSLYQRLDFNSVTDSYYQTLIRKEYIFIKNMKDKILKKAKKVYTKQKETGVIRPHYVDFSRLEKACDDYENRY